MSASPPPRPPLDASLAVLREEERPWGALLHILCAVPIWGFVSSMAVFLYYKNRSREMVFHVQQAVVFHTAIVAVMLAGVTVQVLANILRYVSEPLAVAVETLNLWLCVAAWTLCAASCLWGAALARLGKPFLYPFFGRSVLAGARRKFSERV